jgi:membrane protease YdiL (CAAX protease family)
VDLETIKFSPAWSIGMPIIAVIFLTLVVLVITLILVFVAPQSALIILGSNDFLILGLFLELLFVIPPYWYLRRFFPPGSAKEKFQFLGLPLGERLWKKHAKEIAIGAIFAVGLLGLVYLTQNLSFLFWNALEGPQFVNQGVAGFSGTSSGMTPTTNWQLVLIWVGCFSAVGVSEEILFRGFTQRGLIKSWGKPAGIIITALLFTFAHVTPIIDSMQTIALFFLPYFAISLVLGILYQWRKGNLLANIIAHGLYDSLVFTLAFFGIP